MIGQSQEQQHTMGMGRGGVALFNGQIWNKLMVWGHCLTLRSQS